MRVNGKQKPVDAAEKFAHERATEVMEALNYLQRAGLVKPFVGTFDLGEGRPMANNVHDQDFVARWFEHALLQFAAHEKAVVEKVDPQAPANEPGDTPAEFPPPETMQITALVGRNVRDRAAAVCGAIEACAECMRLVLASAISAALERCQPEERVKALFHQEPKFGSHTNVQTGITAIGGEFRVLIYREREPRESYMLGSVSGRPPMRLLWRLPDMDLFYGPHRLRWMDRRAPDANRTLILTGTA